MKIKNYYMTHSWSFMDISVKKKLFVKIRSDYFMISSLSWHSSNKFDSAHLTNSEISVRNNSCQLKILIHDNSWSFMNIRVKKQNKKKSCVYMERAVFNQLTLLYNSSNSR